MGEEEFELISSFFALKDFLTIADSVYSVLGLWQEKVSSSL